MKNIILSNGGIVIVNDSDYLKFNRWKWRKDRNGYACRSSRNGKKWKLIYLHRLINNTPHGKDTDHINKDVSDNRKKNLRTLPRNINLLNCNKSKRNSTGVVGVWFNKANKNYQAMIGRRYIGTFTTIKKAKRLRDKMIKTIIKKEKANAES